MLSVIIPTYNRSESLRRCLESYFNQSISASDYEIIVVDDGSTDGTEKNMKGLITTVDVSLKYFKHDKNKGPAAARNLGVKVAQGEIIFFTGDDTVAAPDLIKKHIIWHKKNPGKEMAILGDTKWAKNIKKTPFMEYLESGPQFGYQNITDTSKVSYEFFYTTNVSLKKDFMVECGYFDEEFKLAMWEDIELGYRLNKHGLRLVYERDAVVYHHHPTDILKFLKRQYNVGRYAVLYLSKHSELNYILPQLLNPILILHDDQINSVSSYLHNIDQSINIDELSRATKYSLFSLYRLLCNASRDRGFLDEVNAQKLVERNKMLTLFGSKNESLKELPTELPFLLNFIISTYDDQIQEKMKDKDSLIEIILNSWSWRLTAPLRWFRKHVLRSTD